METVNQVNHESLTFVWTRAHIGNDVLAKAATKLESITRTPLPLLTAPLCFQSQDHTYNKI